MYKFPALKHVCFQKYSNLNLRVFTVRDRFCPPMWCLHTKLYKGAYNVLANNSETVAHKDLRFGQIVYILVFYNISFSWLLPPDGFQFIFLCRVYCVTVKMKNKTMKNIMDNLIKSNCRLMNPGGYSPFWSIRGCATGQGMVFFTSLS